MTIASQIYTEEKYQLIPPGWLLKYKTALLIDSVDLLYHAVLDLTLSEQAVIKSQSLMCNGTQNWDSGHTIVNYLKGVINSCFISS